MMVPSLISMVLLLYGMNRSCFIITKFTPKLPMRRKFISIIEGLLDNKRNLNTAFYTERGLRAELEAFQSRDLNIGPTYISSITGSGSVGIGSSESSSSNLLRIFQFNMLADGLSGLRTDLGAFSRAKREDLVWDHRKIQLLYELLQYNPDVITLQECDHYYDFFLPELSLRGYDGIFAPKPASACLEVHPNSDGCALFFKRTKVKVISTETLTYALPPSDDVVSAQPKNQYRYKKVQNQVAIISVCQLISSSSSSSSSNTIGRTADSAAAAAAAAVVTVEQQLSSPFIIATTHLKAKKNAEGEECRHYETTQLLNAVTKCSNSFLPLLLQYQQSQSTVSSQSPSSSPTSLSPPPLPPPSSLPIIITGDFNACPTKNSTVFGFPCIVYPLLKEHPSMLRSVYNDDLLSVLSNQRKRSLFYDNKLKINLPTVFKEDYTRKAVVNRWNIDDDEVTGDTVIDDNGIEGIGEDKAGVVVPLDENLIWTTWKARRKKGVEQIVKHCIDYIFYSAPTIEAVSVLGLFDDKDIPPELFPNESYPSDHIALVADLKFKT